MGQLSPTWRNAPEPPNGMYVGVNALVTALHAPMLGNS
jgi:hypothetical protein